ncbi:MAG: adenylate kinase [Patescibacteria group bacterium]|jgi:adenylate kinase
MNYKIALFGPQGSGKGTQGEKLAEFLKIPLVITGNIFRKNIKEGTELGKLASSFINKGALVPDDVTIKMIINRLSDNDCQNGFLLDGFPRSLAQSEALDKFTSLSHVLLIDIKDEESVRRIANRRVCLNCGSTFHLLYKPSKKEGICDTCQTKLVQRDDDTEKALRNRLAIYHEQSEPLLKKYQQENILHKINGEKSIEEVWEEVKKIFS